MRRRNKLPELLAPAGDFECIVAAVRGGADAVYVGGKLYSARAYAKNFDTEELTRAVAYCHLHGVRLYVTLNTLLYDREIPDALRFARELYMIGVDALIVADVGLICALREYLPQFELHASTQLSVHNSLGADMAHSLGCNRVVLARELSGENIRRVTENCIPETEVFLHGALCVCHSGQCLFSSMVGGRSGNRGECAQPCRLPYNGERYILSLCDLSLARHIQELVASGTASLKIEGRMKSPDYVYTVTSIYRKLLDEIRNSTRSEDAALEKIFSRGGFTDGYFRGKHNSEAMTGVRSTADKVASREAGGGTYTPDRISVGAKVRLKLGERSQLTLTEKVKRGLPSVTVFGDVPEVAKSVCLTKESVCTRLSKMGNTFLSLDKDDIELELDDGINLSPASLNALRRAAAEQFEIRGRECDERDIPAAPKKSFTPKRRRTAMFYKPEEFSGLGECRGFFDISFLPLWRLDESGVLPNGVALPPVIMEDEVEDVRVMLQSAKEKGITYALIGNIGHIPLALEYGFTPVPDFRLNVMNSYTRASYEKMGLRGLMLSPELTVGEGASVGGSVIVYGRIPLMLTERCFVKENFGCERCGRCSLTDRRGVRFPILREYQHRNVIFNSVVTYVADKPNVRKLFAMEHYIFSCETAEDIEKIIASYRESLPMPLDVPTRRIGKREAKK